MTARQFARNGGDGALILLFASGASLWAWPNGLTASLFTFAFGCLGLAMQDGVG